MPRGYIMTLFPWLYGLVQHHLHLGEWGWSTQFCSDRPKTSDLDVSDQVLSIPALPQARISGAKCLFYFLDFRSDFATIPYHTPCPPFDFAAQQQTTDLRQLQPKNASGQKKIID